jgi:hypothetical protein
MYVRITSRAGAHAWPAPRAGFALALAGRQGFARVDSPARPAERDPTRFVLLSRAGSGREDLLWCPHAVALAEHSMELVSADARGLAILAGDAPGAQTLDSAHFLQLWPADLDGAPEGESLAADYQHPAVVTARAGRVLTDQPGDLNTDGFNESEGLYELAVDGGVLRFSFDPGRFVRHQPMFRVHGTAGMRCWVYADGQLIDALERDAAENLVFRWPRALSQRLNVEVHARPPDAGVAP